MPNIQDLEFYKIIVNLLYYSGVIHVDLNRCNSLITDSSSKIFDFEVSIILRSVDPVEVEKEVRTLAA